MLTVNNLTGFGHRQPIPNLSCINTVNKIIQDSSNFGTLSIGNEPATNERRFIFAALGGHEGTENNLNWLYSSVTIAGFAATVIQGTSSISATSIAYVEVPTGTTATITASTTRTPDGHGIAVYRVISGPLGIIVDSATSTATPLSATLDFIVGSVGIAVAANEDGGSYTWSGLSEIIDSSLGSSEVAQFSSAMSTFSTASLSRTITATPSAGAGDGRRGTFVSISPFGK